MAIDSMISREESGAIKGLLILLIVLGHIGRSFGFLQHWLYSFHFIVFFMLPFLYGQRSFNVRKVGRSLLRVYVPYIWVLILCLLIALVTGYVELQSVQTYLFAFFHGSQALLKETFGFNFPWFMPAFFFLSLFLSILSEKRKWSSFLLILILVYGLGMTIYIALTFPDGLWALSCVSRAAAYFFIGYVAFLFLAKNRSKLHLPCWRNTVAFIFIVSLVIQAILQKYTSFSDEYPVAYAIAFFITEITTPFAALCFFYGIRQMLSKSKLLIVFGNLSFEVYCFNVIVLNILWKVVDFLGFQSSLFVAVLVFVFTCVVSLGIAVGLKKLPWLHGLLFPRGMRIAKN